MAKAPDSEIKALMAEYIKLAKRADMQLERLEKLSENEHFKGVLSYAYARAERDINAWDTKRRNAINAERRKAGLPVQEAKTYEKPRFNRSIPTKKQSLEAKLADVKAFLESSTNTKTKIIKVYKKRADTMNANNGTNFTWQDLANYYESKASETLDSKYGSKTLVKALNAIRSLGSSNTEMKKNLRKYSDQNKKLSDDAIVNEVASRILDMGYDYDSLFGGKEKKDIYQED